MADLTLNIYTISRCTHNYYRRELRKLHLTMGQFPFVMGIAGHDGISQEQLSQSLKISKSTTTAIVRQLLAKGLISRETDPGDRRNFQLHPTAAARTLIPKIQAVIDACHRELLTGLSESERTRYVELTAKVREQAEKLRP